MSEITQSAFSRRSGVIESTAENTARNSAKGKKKKKEAQCVTLFQQIFLSYHSASSSNKEQNEMEIHAQRKQELKERVALVI